MVNAQSLYPATVGNVRAPRPGIFDMLGRAKWDAWAKHKDLDPFEAKWFYVDALLKVLRKYSGKTIAMDLVQELEAYGGDPANIVTSRTFTKSPASDASGSTVSDVAPAHYTRENALASSQNEITHASEADSISEEESDDEPGDLPPANSRELAFENRPQSSLSSHRYRTPMAGSLVMSPPPTHGIPPAQPHPGYSTPSTFADPTSVPSSLYPTTGSYAGHYSQSSRAELVSPPHVYQSHPAYNQTSQYGPGRPASRPTLERALESVQVQLAALTERLESVETRSVLPSRVSLSPRGIGSPAWATGRGSPHDNNPQWDIDDLGMWSIVINPVTRAISVLRDLTVFFARNENRSPTMIIVRRLFLDVSFLVCVIAVIGALWRKSGVRRREVKAALVILWRAIVGAKPERVMLNRGV